MRDGEIVLRLRQPLPGGLVVPSDRAIGVLGHADAFGIHQAEGVLGERVALHGERPEFGQRGGVFAVAIGARAGQEIGPRVGRQAEKENHQYEEPFHLSPQYIGHSNHLPHNLVRFVIKRQWSVNIRPGLYIFRGPWSVTVITLNASDAAVAGPTCCSAVDDVYRRDVLDQNAGAQ